MRVQQDKKVVEDIGKGLAGMLNDIRKAKIEEVSNLVENSRI